MPVTSSKWIVSVGEGQKLVWESVEGTKSTTNKIIFDIMIGKNIKAGLLEARHCLRPPSQPLNKKQDQPQVVSVRAVVWEAGAPLAPVGVS